MEVFGTEMRLMTFIFVILEIALLFYQLLYYLSGPQDKSRLWYMILLFLLIVYNITGGLFPDPKINIPIVTQNIIAYGSGFLMASYFPFYFYKGMNLKGLRFIAVYGVPLFLILPYIIFFVIAYSINKDLDFAVEYGVIIPFFYSVIALWAILRAIRLYYITNPEKKNYPEMLAVYIAVIPWGSMTIFSFFHIGQLIEVLFTNLGFIAITIIFISRTIRRARIEYERQVLFDEKRISVFFENCIRYQLSTREIEVSELIKQGLKYKGIADKLFISEKTVSNHIQHIFEKVKVTSKTELIHRLTDSIQ